MTLEEISKVGELVTEHLDESANVIWGARVAEGMKGRISVMTIITGVSSPWMLGKSNSRKQMQMDKEFSDELGIEIIQ